MRLYTYSSSFTRPNDVTAYAANDLIANSTTANAVVPLVWIPTTGFLLTAVKFKLSGTATNTNAQFSLHLFQNTPLVTNGDNGVFAPTFEFSYLGNVYVDCTVFPVCGTDIVGQSPVDPNVLPIFLDQTPTVSDTATRQIYGLIRAEGAFTPSALQTITVNLIGVD